MEKHHIKFYMDNHLYMSTSKCLDHYVMHTTKGGKEISLQVEVDGAFSLGIHMGRKGGSCMI